MTQSTLPTHLRPFVANADPLALLARLITNTRGFIYRRRHDRAWTMEFISDGCRDVTGYDPHRFVTDGSVSFAGLIHTADRDRVETEVAAAVDHHRRRTLRYRIRTAYESIVRVEDRLLPVYHADGTLAAIEGVIDLAKDDPVAVNEDTGWAEAFADAFRRSPVPLVLSRADGMVGAINAACVRRFDLPTDALLATDRLPDLLRCLATRAGKGVTEHGLDGGTALGAVSLPVASPLGSDSVLTVIPPDAALRQTLWWRGATRPPTRRAPRRRFRRAQSHPSADPRRAPMSAGAGAASPRGVRSPRPQLGRAPEQRDASRLRRASMAARQPAPLEPCTEGSGEHRCSAPAEWRSS